MRHEEEFSIWLAGGVLRAGGEDIQASVLEEVRDKVASGTPLDQALALVSRSERQAGDFGAEIIGPLLLPILIEGLKTFWNLYASELQKKVAGDLAKLTIEKVKDLFRSALGGAERDKTLTSMEEVIREVAAKRKLNAKATERLVALVLDPNVASELDAAS
jgi:hypothetical protein